MLKLAATLRRFAEDADDRSYAPKFLAGHRAGEPEPDWEHEAALHAPVDLRI